MRVFPLRNLAEYQGMNVKTVAKQLSAVAKNSQVKHSRKWFGLLAANNSELQFLGKAMDWIFLLIASSRKFIL